MFVVPQHWMDGVANPCDNRNATNDVMLGTSQGEMLSAGTGTKGSAGYVAIERVTGKLNDRSGSFVLQHTATMNRGAPHLNIVVIPDSGTEELTGLTGTMHIVIAKGNHSYEFEYSFSDGQ